MKQFRNFIATKAQLSQSVREPAKVVNWFILKLELLQSIVSSTHDNGVPIQWSADATERCHITEIKDPSHSTNNQNYESQICHYLDRNEKCRRFDLATAIQQAHLDTNPLDNGHSGFDGYNLEVSRLKMRKASYL